MQSEQKFCGLNISPTLYYDSMAGLKDSHIFEYTTHILSILKYRLSDLNLTPKLIQCVTNNLVNIYNYS